VHAAYVPHEAKHKWPKGFGSLCPKMPLADAQDLLERAIAVPEVRANALWLAVGRWCFCAYPSPHAGLDAWHGFPVIGREVNERVFRALRDHGLIIKTEINRLRAQTELPDTWP